MWNNIKDVKTFQILLTTTNPGLNRRLPSWPEVRMTRNAIIGASSRARPRRTWWRRTSGTAWGSRRCSGNSSGRSTVLIIRWERDQVLQWNVSFSWYCNAFISCILKFDPFVIRTSESESLIRAVTSKDFINVPKLTNWQGSFVQLLRSFCRACRCFKFSWWENAIDVNFIYSEILHWKDSCWIDISGGRVAG